MARYVIRGGRAGYERLQLLAKVWSPSTSDLFDRVGIAKGSRCLDVGCGGGEVTFEIARRVGPGGRVTGIDMDEIKLDLGREAALSRTLGNVEFSTATDVSDWHETNVYELVYCRFLLEHLSCPLELLSNMWAAVAPGGALVVEDADFGALFCDPPNDGFAFWSRSNCTILERRGGDPLLGRKLYRYFLETDIPSPDMNLVQVAHTAKARRSLYRRWKPPQRRFSMKGLLRRTRWPQRSRALRRIRPRPGPSSPPLGCSRSGLVSRRSSRPVASRRADASTAQ